MANSNPSKISGEWTSGFALDLHTVSSTYLGLNEAGHEVYDTQRSELGELLYRLKYRGDASAGDEIIKTVAGFINPRNLRSNLIVPVPPSGKRALQPVLLLAKGIGTALNLPIADCITTTRPPTEVKGVQDVERRKELLKGLYAVDPKITRGKNILLFDDLYRSGSTLNAITRLLLKEGEAEAVRVLTITRTRSNQ